MGGSNSGGGGDAAGTRTADEQDPLLGRLVGARYRIEGPIGAGALGPLYRAVQATLDRRVALELVGPRGRPPGFQDRLLRETARIAQVSHPNTLRVLDFGALDDGAFIARELPAGRTLAQTLDREGPLAQNRALHIAQQLAHALREAHAAGLLHRDLKPASLLLLRQQDDHDFVKLLDLGIATILAGEAAAAGIAGMALGSPHYAAPEQIRGQAVDPRADVYAIGGLLFHMLTGHPPFTGSSAREVALQQLTVDPTAPGARRAGIARAVDGLVLRCLAKKRDERFQSMDELLTALRGAREALRGKARAGHAAGAGATASTASAPAKAATLAASAPRRRREVFALPDADEVAAADTSVQAGAETPAASGPEKPEPAPAGPRSSRIGFALP